MAVLDFEKLLLLLLHYCFSGWYSLRVSRTKKNFYVFGFSEKRTKFEKNLPHGFDKSADLLSKRQNHEEDFFQIMCASQKVRTLIIVCKCWEYVLFKST